MYGTISHNLQSLLYFKLRQEVYHSKKKYRKPSVEQVSDKLIQLDSQEYLANPASYFMHKEHWSLDG